MRWSLPPSARETCANLIHRRKVAQMANLTIRNVPVDLYRLLQRRAKAHNRILSEEVIATLQDVISEGRPANTQKLIAQVGEMTK
jgi:plasmid stability protein